MAAHKRSMLAVFTLLFVAPFVAEYLLGDLPLMLLPLMLAFAPAYGGGAILIRETARRTGRGWPSMLMMGAAYAVINEGLMTQSLFNPDYMHKNWHLLQVANIPALGMGGWWTMLMLNVHMFWSMGVSIALVEALFPADAESPWLGWFGDSVVALVFLLGAAVGFGLGYNQNHYVAPRAQLASAALATVLLIACAFLIPARRARQAGGMAPSPWITGAVTFALGWGVMSTPWKWGWGAVGAMLAMDVVFLVLATWMSRRTGWSAMHVMSLATGGALAYGIRAFTTAPLVGSVLGMRISNAVFLAIALLLIVVGVRRVRSHQRLAAGDN